MELNLQDLVELVGDALVKFCPWDCIYCGYEVDVSLAIGPNGLEEFVAGWVRHHPPRVEVKVWEVKGE